MPFLDRTNEFRACVDSISKRSASIPNRDAEQKQRLLAKNQTGGAKSEFTRMASGIGKDIANTTLKLGKLAQLAKRKTLFDDRPVEISVSTYRSNSALVVQWFSHRFTAHFLQELTFIIKQDIAHINKSIAALQQYVKSRNASSGSKQVEEHNNNVVMLLQSKLAATSMSFKDVLEVRTQNMKESKDRTEQFMYSTASAAAQAPATNSLLFANRQQPSTDVSGSPFRPSTPSGGNKGKSKAMDSDLLALDIGSAEEGKGANGQADGGFMQMQLVEQQDTYIQSRATAIESIESTIAELGQIFTQLAQMVAEQRETVQRIDADTIDIANNVSGAQRELLKYYASISSNRWLMLKVFGVLIVFVRVSGDRVPGVKADMRHLQFLVFILVS
ncbi:cis-Golgi t-SNARE syntaxin [Tulasnella sp. 403]|nr:cis-Golgi t-SNARE syntaxin [Tulasnella sp. 403]